MTHLSPVSFTNLFLFFFHPFRCSRKLKGHSVNRINQIGDQTLKCSSYRQLLCTRIVGEDLLGWIEAFSGLSDRFLTTCADVLFSDANSSSGDDSPQGNSGVSSQEPCWRQATARLQWCFSGLYYLGIWALCSNTCLMWIWCYGQNAVICGGSLISVCVFCCACVCVCLCVCACTLCVCWIKYFSLWVQLKKSSWCWLTL